MTRKRESVRFLGCTISPFRAHEWRASIPRPRGLGRVRAVFHDLPAAEDWIERNISAVRATAEPNPPTPGEVADLRKAESILPPGVTLLEAVRAGVAALSRRAALRPSLTVGEAVKSFLAEKRAANCRARTVIGYASYLSILPADRPLSSLTPDDLIAIIGERNGHDWNNHVKVFRTLWAWAIARGYVEASPAASLPRRRLDWTPPPIYTADAVEAMLHAAESRFPELVPLLAIEAFAGVRVSGVLRLPLSAVSLRDRTILVPGKADKLRTGYLAEVRPNLAAWMDAYPFAPPGMTYNTYHKKLSRLLAAAGVQPVRNGLRHAFASHLLALTGDAVRTAAQLGHWHGGTDTLFAHYRRIVSPADARRYFAILPACPTVPKKPPSRETT